MSLSNAISPTSESDSFSTLSQANTPSGSPLLKVKKTQVTPDSTISTQNHDNNQHHVTPLYVLKIYSTQDELIYFHREVMACVKMQQGHKHIIKARQIGLIQEKQQNF